MTISSIPGLLAGEFRIFDLTELRAPVISLPPPIKSKDSICGKRGRQIVNFQSTSGVYIVNALLTILRNCLLVPVYWPKSICTIMLSLNDRTANRLPKLYRISTTLDTNRRLVRYCIGVMKLELSNKNTMSFWQPKIDIKLILLITGRNQCSSILFIGVFDNTKRYITIVTDWFVGSDGTHSYNANVFS